MPALSPQAYTAIAIAAAFALIGFLPLAWASARRPFVWLCLLAGVVVGPVAREGAQMAWEWLGPIGGLINHPAGGYAHLLIFVAVAELVKVTVPLIAATLRPIDEATGLAYGAAAGAGFGFMATQPVLTMVLGLAGSPFITPLSTAVAILGWFFPILAHIATTAYLARAGVRGGFGLGFLLMSGLQYLLGVAQQRLPVISSVPVGLVVTMVAALWLFAYLWNVRLRAVEGTVGA